MPNIAGVYDKKNEEDEDNKQYVGGADGRGGGSGLNVIGPPSDDPYSGIKQNASSGGERYIPTPLSDSSYPLRGSRYYIIVHYCFLKILFCLCEL